MTQKAKTDRWSLIEEIFQNAAERPESERVEYIRHACGDDMELRDEVESLLASDREGATVQSLIAEDVRELDHAANSSEAGMQVGPYRLLREIDSGGMGAVYLGVRSDDQYFQIVAVKMIRKGLECPALILRFRAERQILANLQHPNIGAILDGGELPDGRPYIVMEYVEGQPITLAGECLSIRQRIELFRSVCSAIHYAHQKLIIHRDIKPSNVLVTSENVVKLIDFGISKPLAPELIHEDLPRTETAQRMMTPDYASPEQFLGQEVTTASDVYSLGVLLFELLTGSRPYNLRELTPAAAEKVICSEEPRKPSQVEGLSSKTKRELAGDLDRIVLMAMDCDPLRRYQSAHHLEEDLVRYLEGKPVVARKATLGYRVKKFAQRNKTAVVVTCTLSALLCASILFYSWQSRRADRRVQQTEMLADSTISEITEKLQQSSASVETQAALFHSALQYLDQLRKSSGNEPRLLLKLSRAYARVGDLEGSPYVANLGNSGVALTSYQEALRMALAAHSRLPGGENTQALIEAYERLGALELFLGKIEEAHDKYQRSLSLANDFWKDKPEDPTRKRLLAMSYARLGDLQLDDLETDTALESFRAAFRIFGTEPNGDEDHDVTLMRLHVRMGGALMEHGSPQEALANRRKALAISEALAQKSPSSNQAQQNLFEAYNFMNAPLVGIETLSVGDSTQAEIYARKARDIVEGMVGRDHSNIWARSHLAYGYCLMGDALRVTRPAAASEWYRKALLVTREVAPSYPVGSYPEDWIAEGDEDLAASLRGSEDAIEKVHLLEDANSVWQQLVHASPGKPQYRKSLMRSDCKLSDSELAVNNLDKARQYADSAVRFFDDFKITSQSLLVLRDLGFCYESLGNVQRQISMNPSFSAARRHAAHTQALQWFQKSAEVWSEWKRRGATTPESEQERRKVERLLGSPKGHG